MIKFNRGFSITKVIETGENYERINCVNLNYGIDEAIVSIRYFYNNEYNYPKDEMIVYFEFSYVLENEIDIANNIIEFFRDNIGCVTDSEESNRYCHNLFYHMINSGWLVNIDYLESVDKLPCEYYNHYTRYCYQYDYSNDKITRKIKVIIS